MYCSKLTVTKGVTLEARAEVRPFRSMWNRAEFTVELTLTENDNLEDAKALAELLIDSWIEDAKKRAQKP